MRTRNRVLLGLLALGASALAPATARAQLDIDPPLPNVLLLVDTSGSMEYLVKPDPTTGANVLPGATAFPGSDCDPTKAPATVLNRWASMVSVLTGTINNFSCISTKRNGATWVSEYGLGVTPPPASTWLSPYDNNYFLPFNRLYSNGCTPGPGVKSGNWWDWPAGSIAYHDKNGAACGSPWTQANDGLLDTFRDRVRFALMTFDTLPHPGTGVNGIPPKYDTGEQGMWSYYNGWSAGGSTYSQGNPPNCTISPYEVGARNPGAPPWEGRLINFGEPAAPLSSVQTTNDHIQEALISMRPYGATPIAGMMDDAKYFLLTDPDQDKNSPTNQAFGPKADPYYIGGCRKEFIILLTDGEPNMDMRPECGTGNGVCPYPNTADQTAAQLAGISGNQQIQTYVVGFGVSNPTALTPTGLTSCTQIDQSKMSAVCANPAAGLKACCALAKIAIAGGTQHAYFADDPVTLKGVLSSILGGISSGSTARTIPIFSSVGATGGQGNGAAAAGYRFVGQFTADATGHLWQGQLKRERFVCGGNPYQASPTAPSSVVGDDFQANVDFNDPANPRQFFSFVAPKVGSLINSGGTIRPAIGTDDGLGLYGQASTQMALSSASNFSTNLGLTSEALAIDPTTPPAACSAAFSTTNGVTCAQSLLQWEVGISSWPKTRDAAACASHAAVCSKLGAIYHSTPAIIGPPRELIRDDSYASFVQQQQDRPIMLYTATTDGQLHAFKVSASTINDPPLVNTLLNNELWSFFPPTVLPNLLSSYDQQALLLDGAPVVADVAGQPPQNPGNPPVYERRRTTGIQWSSVLLAGGGSAGGFYYALDITDPKKPRFLWQLSADSAGSPLFGRTVSTPAIATIALPDTGTDTKEVAVAILPGGTAALLPSGCPTQYKTYTSPVNNNPISLMTSGNYHERANVRCWAPGPARSLTIVRLDNGEVIMNFRGSLPAGPPGLLLQNPQRAQVVPMASPITGVPVAYPGQTGQVANRVYVGDADGVLWRVDLSGTDPLKWTMNVAWDSYSLLSDDPNGLNGQVIQTSPVISTNPLGDTVLLFSTGDQDLLSASASNNRIWSIVEKRNAVANTYQTKENWYLDFTQGERVTGPMGLFDSVAYFSTFAPAGSGSVCSYGASKIWALDYQSAAARFPAGNGVFKQYEDAPNTIVAGVAVTKTPSCDNTSSTTDPYLGSHSYVSSADNGNYQLVWQKGPGNGVVGNSSVKTDASTGIQTLNLQPPKTSTRIDSWATIIE